MYVTVHSEFHNDTVCLIAGLGVFAGRDFDQGTIVISSWEIVFFPHELPAYLPPWEYVFNVNDTHEALPLGYAPIANHHESDNVEHVWTDESAQNMMFVVRELLHVHV